MNTRVDDKSERSTRMTLFGYEKIKYRRSRPDSDIEEDTFVYLFIFGGF